jgi:hypothetical protein
MNHRAWGKNIAAFQRLRLPHEMGGLSDGQMGYYYFDHILRWPQALLKSFELIRQSFTPPDFKIHTYPTDVQFKNGSNRQDPASRKACQDFLDSNRVPGEKTHNAVRELRILYSRVMPVWKRLIDIVAALFLRVFFSPPC